MVISTEAYQPALALESCEVNTECFCLLTPQHLVPFPVK